MVGPSSSHTAGAARIGFITRKLLKEEPASITLKLHGSFAATGTGHGTVKALTAGLLGMKEDNTLIPHSLEIAAEKNIFLKTESVILKDAHPNSVLIEVEGKNNKQLKVEAASIGGGRVIIKKIDGLTVNFSGDMPTLIVHHDDAPGHISEITTILSQLNLNIASMQVYRKERGGQAVAVIETDASIPDIAVNWHKGLAGIHNVTYINTEEE